MSAGRDTKTARPMVSVIMPAYNAAATLEASAKSVLSQSFRDLELIIVDDGSIDGTASICRRLSARDERVRSISTANFGPASARNTGLDMAKGKYLTLADSDDLLLPEMLEEMVRAAEETKADAVVCGASIEYPNGGGTERQLRFGESGLYKGEDLARLFDLEPMTIFFSGWGKLYRRDIIEENGIRMDIAYRITEDTDFAMRYLTNCASVCLIDKCFYRYMQVNAASLTSVKKAEALRDAAFNVAKRQKELMLKWGLPEEEAESRSNTYLFSQLNAAAFIKLRSDAKHAEKKAFFKELMTVDGFKSYLRHSKLSSRVLAAGYSPAWAYTRLHDAYVNSKRKTR